jgi:mRNA-degrading endonuclease toxin of MazEF toxin-antitoxin module
MAHQIRVIAKERLGEKCGCITLEEIKLQVRNSIRTYLDI